MEGSASARRPYNHPSASRVGHTGAVGPPSERISQNSVMAKFAEFTFYALG